MKQLVLALLALSIAAFAPVGDHQCERMRDDFVHPARNAVSFLKTDPDAETLAGPGCLYLLRQLRSFPAGAQLARRLAAQKNRYFASHCLYRASSIHYTCGEPKAGDVHCLPQSYSFCAQWEYSMTNDPRLESAMELSLKLDSAYEKGQRLCGAAFARDARTAMEVAGELERYLESEVIPRSDRIHSRACDR